MNPPQLLDPRNNYADHTACRLMVIVHVFEYSTPLMQNCMGKTVAQIQVFVEVY
jgi:hypothetical protein